MLTIGWRCNTEKRPERHILVINVLNDNMYFHSGVIFGNHPSIHGFIGISLSIIFSHHSPQPVSRNWGPSERVQMAAAFTRMTLSPPQLCLPTHRTSFFFIDCFRCWTKQPKTCARTSARCIMGAIYQSHHALQALNTATVFSVFAAIFLTALSPSLSLYGSFAGAAVSFYCL